MTNRDTEIVSRIRARLVAQLSDDRFELWFGAGTRMEWQDDKLQITADTTFRADRLRNGLMQEIRRVLRQELGKDVAVTFAVDPALALEDADADDQARSANLPHRAVASRGAVPVTTESVPRPRLHADSARSATVSGWGGRRGPSRKFARLETLVSGACNRIALGAAQLVVSAPGQMNPLFVHGPSGVGKTHLLEGIWSQVRHRGGRRIIYLTAEQFTTYFLQALKGSGLPSFRQKYRAVDLLILDDVQFFVGKQATITELLHTLDALLRDARQVVMAADRPPAQLMGLGSELQARLSGGLVCAVQLLDLPTRRSLLEQMAQQRQLPLEDAILDRIAERAPGDARQLIGVLNRLWATRQTLQQNLSVRLVNEVLDELFPSSGGMIKLDDIERVICDEFGLDPDVLRSDQRARRISHPRMLAMWLARKHTHAALTEIGEFFGRRSHSTVLSAQHKVERWVRHGQDLSCDRATRDVRSVLSRLERNLRA